MVGYWERSDRMGFSSTEIGDKLVYHKAGWLTHPVLGVECMIIKTGAELESERKKVLWKGVRKRFHCCD